MNLTKHLNTCHFKRYKCITNCCTLYSWEGMRTSKETYIILGLQHYLTHEMKNKRWPTTTTHFETTKRPLQHHMTFEGISDFVYLDSMNCFAKIHLPTDCWISHSWTASYLTHLWFTGEKKWCNGWKRMKDPWGVTADMLWMTPLKITIFNTYSQGIKKRVDKTSILSPFTLWRVAV